MLRQVTPGGVTLEHISEDAPAEPGSPAGSAGASQPVSPSEGGLGSRRPSYNGMGALSMLKSMQRQTSHESDASTSPTSPAPSPSRGGSKAGPSGAARMRGLMRATLSLSGGKKETNEAKTERLLQEERRDLAVAVEVETMVAELEWYYDMIIDKAVSVLEVETEDEVRAQIEEMFSDEPMELMEMRAETEKKTQLHEKLKVAWSEIRTMMRKASIKGKKGLTDEFHSEVLEICTKTLAEAGVAPPELPPKPEKQEPKKKGRGVDRLQRAGRLVKGGLAMGQRHSVVREGDEELEDDFDHQDDFDAGNGRRHSLTNDSARGGSSAVGRTTSLKPDNKAAGALSMMQRVQSMR